MTACMFYSEADQLRALASLQRQGWPAYIIEAKHLLGECERLAEELDKPTCLPRPR